MHHVLLFDHPNKFCAAPDNATCRHVDVHIGQIACAFMLILEWAACRFFVGYRVRPDGIHFVMHADGRPSGMAFVEFDCPQEAMRALVSPLYLPSLLLFSSDTVPRHVV